MRKFLAEAEPAPADLKQRARSVAAQQAAQLGLLEEAESALAEYAKAEPRNVADLHRMNLLVASAYVKKKDYARAAAPAAEAYAAALEYARTSKDPVQRDSTIFGAGSFYANVLVKAGRRAEGLRVAQEMRARAFAIPSARLYGQATELVLRQGEPFGPPPEVAGLEPLGLARDHRGRSARARPRQALRAARQGRAARLLGDVVHLLRQDDAAAERAAREV